MTTFLQELKRRNVVRVTLGYLAVAWLFTQVADIVLSNFGADAWVMQALIVLFIAGLPIVVVLAWIYDLTPEGVQRTDDVAVPKKLVPVAGRKLDFGIIAVLSLALIAVAIDQYIIPRNNARLGPQSVIVLPFSSNQEEQAGLFADGLLGEILTQLYKIEALTTIGRATAMHYRGSDKPVGEIARELGVAAVVSGNLIEAADRVRFDVELLEPRTGRMLWVNSYELPHSVQAMFDIQADIAIQIASALRAELSADEQAWITDKPTTSEAAYDHYLRGEGYRQRSFLKDAIDAYEQATKEDPEFAAAWSALATARADASWLGLAHTTIDEAQFALEQARRLAPDALDTKFANAVMLTNLNRFDEAIEQFDRVLELQPGKVEAIVYQAGMYGLQLRFDEAIKSAEKAVALDPMSIAANWQLAFVLAESWNFEEAKRYYDRALALEPQSPHSWRFWMRYRVYLWGLGDINAARRILDEAPASISTIQGEIQLAYVERDLPKMQELLETTDDDLSIRYLMLARLHRAMGDGDMQRKYAESMRLTAERVLEAELARGAMPLEIDHARSEMAIALALAGDESEAIRNIERAVARAAVDSDRLNAAPVNHNEVLTYIFLDKNDTAVERLRALLSWATPATLTPHRLRLDPDFDTLRGHPEFEKLLKELASREN